MAEIQNKESNELSLEELRNEIHQAELKLKELREKYIKRTGVLPPRNFQNGDWHWTIFMTLGIAYITFITYYFGIKQAGRGEGFWIPDFLYNAEIQFYGVLTFFIIFGVVIIQSNRLRGYQVLTVFLGFWCAHWLLYDWTWWAMELGFGHEEWSTFWTQQFYSPLLIEKPPMWLFFTLAVTGAGFSIYTFLVPENYKKLIPTIIWLCAVYMNGLVCSMLGLTTTIALIIGLTLISGAFGLTLYFSIQRIKEIRKRNREKQKLDLPNKITGPLSKPFNYILLGLVIAIFIFSAIIPLIGFIIGMGIWYIFPLVYFVINTTPFQKLSRNRKILVIISTIIGIALISVFLTLAMSKLR